MMVLIELQLRVTLNGNCTNQIMTCNIDIDHNTVDMQ